MGVNAKMMRTISNQIPKKETIDHILRHDTSLVTPSISNDEYYQARLQQVREMRAHNGEPPLGLHFKSPPHIQKYVNVNTNTHHPNRDSSMAVSLV